VSNEDKPLDELYFEWLYKHIGSVKNRNPARSHWHLAQQLFSIPFNNFIGTDDNRAADGKELRQQFISECDIEDIEVNWLALDCSLLEMLIALANRTAYESSATCINWFWKFIENLGLKQYTDDIYDQTVDLEVERLLNRFVNRRYKRNGEGGIFPLRNPRKDQRREELWYQMSAYLLEDEHAITG
jgi:hypothetical protein